jgi:TRAP-type C4-dicarboxylate transport system permease small subunit
MNLAQNIWYWRIAIIRVFLYGGYVAWGMWKAGTNGYKEIGEMSPLQFWDLIGDMVFVGMGGVLLAFLDNTLQQLRGKNGNGDSGDSPKEPKPPTVSEQIQQPKG